MSDRTGGIRVLAFTGCGACCRLRPAQNPHVWAGATPPFGGLSRPRGSLPPKPQGIRQSHVRLVMCADREPRTVHQVSHMSTRSDRLMGFIQCQVKPPGRARPQVQGAPRTAATGCRLGEIVPPCSVASQVRRSAPPLRAPSATWTRPARGSRVPLSSAAPKISRNDKSETSRRDLSSGAVAVCAVSERSPQLHTACAAERAGPGHAHVNGYDPYRST